MSEATDKLRTMLKQAQVFAQEAPVEAVARARLAAREAEAALAGAQGEEREELGMLRAFALSRAEKYEALFETWDQAARARANLFTTHERQRIEQPIPPKV